MHHVLKTSNIAFSRISSLQYGHFLRCKNAGVE